MKKILIIFLSFFTCYSFSQEISGEVTYKKVLDLGKLKASVDDSKSKALLAKVQEENQGKQYTLTFNANESTYTRLKTVQNDAEGAFTKLNLGNFKGVLYTNMQDNETIHQKEYLGELILVKDSINYNWELLNETKKIGKYNCQKALLKIKYADINGNSKVRKVVCWYTPDIPVPFGPEKFNSLPGLILELSTSKGAVVATEITISNTKELLEIKKPKKGKEFSEKNLMTRQGRYF